MRWLGNGSGNIEDRRSGGGGKLIFGGGAAILAVVLGLLFGKNPSDLLGVIQNVAPQEQTGTTGVPQDQEGKFVSQVLGYTEDVWVTIFNENGATYKKPTVVLFRGQVQSACGFASAATGPFYCPGDQKVYIDLSFYDELKERFGAPGDFAQAYVIAHEIGHHVQNLLL